MKESITAHLIPFVAFHLCFKFFFFHLYSFHSALIFHGNVISILVILSLIYYHNLKYFKCKNLQSLSLSYLNLYCR